MISTRGVRDFRWCRTPRSLLTTTGEAHRSSISASKHDNFGFSGWPGVSISMTALVQRVCLRQWRELLIQVYHRIPQWKAMELVFSGIPCFQQRYYDCVLFVIATILHLMGNDLQQISFDQRKLQAHLARCYERRRLT